MIDFTCPTCGKAFSVADHLAGRTAKCKQCRATLTVPAIAAAAAPDPSPRLPVRLRRLTADAEQMAAVFANSPTIAIESSAGSPPDVYVVRYRIRGLERIGSAKPTPRDEHRVEVQLTSEYPRVSPKCKMLTPIFHPNIDPATICVGDHWTAGERHFYALLQDGEP